MGRSGKCTKLYAGNLKGKCSRTLEDNMEINAIDIKVVMPELNL
jgi:hypothetical protein